VRQELHYRFTVVCDEKHVSHVDRRVVQFLERVKESVPLVALTVDLEKTDGEQLRGEQSGQAPSAGKRGRAGKRSEASRQSIDAGDADEARVPEGEPAGQDATEKPLGRSTEGAYPPEE